MKFFLIPLVVLFSNSVFSRTAPIAHGEFFQEEGTSVAISSTLTRHLDGLIKDEIISAYGLKEYVTSTTLPSDDHDTNIKIFKIYDVSYVKWKCDSTPLPNSDSGVCGPSTETEDPVCEYVIYYPSEDLVDLTGVSCSKDVTSAIPNFSEDEDDSIDPIPAIVKQAPNNEKIIEAVKALTRYHSAEAGRYGTDEYWFDKPKFLFFNETDNSIYFEQQYSYIEQVSEEIGASKEPINICHNFFYDYETKEVGEMYIDCGAKIVTLLDVVDFRASYGEIFEEELHRTLERFEFNDRDNQNIKEVKFYGMAEQAPYVYKFELHRLSGTCEYVLYNPAEFEALKAVSFTGLQCK